MRRLTHVLMSPPCRLARLALGEKRLACDLQTAPNAMMHLPVFVDLDGTTIVGLWALLDRLEGEHPDHPLLPESAMERSEALRLVDWAMTSLYDQVTRRIVFEKASQGQTGSLIRRPPEMETVRQGRAALSEVLPILGTTAETRGYLVGRELTLADLAVAAHLSAIDYYGEVPWNVFPAVAEWYMRIKSRPSFRSLLSDRVPGQPPVLHYAELDF